MNAFYQLLNRTTTDNITTAHYQCLQPSQGAWNEHEQHMSASTGLICHELEKFSPRPDLQIGRISLDILGLIHFGEITLTTQTIRAGRTIELVETTMSANGKTCIVARAWRMQTSDTSEVAGLEDQKIINFNNLPDWDGMKYWGGGYINSIKFKYDLNHNRNGNGFAWLNNDLDMVAGEPTSDFVHLMGMVDTANGIVPRIHQADGIKWAFPNLDLQIHLHRIPTGRWLGLQTVQQIGENGIGLTSSILHDEKGAFGRSEQILTVRKL